MKDFPYTIIPPLSLSYPSCKYRFVGYELILMWGRLLPWVMKNITEGYIHEN